MHFTGMDLDQIAATVTEDGAVSAEEATAVREHIMEDNVVTRAEANMLFAVNDKAGSHKNTHRTWRGVFVDGIATHLLEDGVIDTAEATWLLEKVGADGNVDVNERALLSHLADRCSEMPQALADKISQLGL